MGIAGHALTPTFARQQDPPLTVPTSPLEAFPSRRARGGDLRNSRTERVGRSIVVEAADEEDVFQVLGNRGQALFVFRFSVASEDGWSFREQRGDAFG
jgi:hypothetical protein